MRTAIGVCLALTVMTLAVYLQVGHHEFLVFDDDLYVTENPHVARGITVENIVWAFTSVHAANWHPLAWLSHMADVQLYGMNPGGHHLTNVVIHTVSAVLLLILLFRLTGALWQSSFVAALFALHPLHVESVAWVAERKDVLSTLFWIVTLLFYAEYVAKRKATPYVLALISFALGLMAKPMLVTLPVVMLLLDFWPFGRYGHEEQGQELHHPSGASQLAALVKEKIPFFACALLSAVITIFAQHKGGAIQNLVEVPLGLRIENALVAYVKYIGKAIWPHDLAALYPMPPSVPLWQAIGALLVLLLVSALTIRAGRRHPYLAVGWFWFLVTLLPVIGLIQVGAQSMADRYTYIPLTGLFIMAAWSVPDLTKRLPYRDGVLAVFVGAVIAASAAATWQQLGYWRNGISLFRHAIDVTAGNSIAHINLGVSLTRNGNKVEAIQEFRKALRIAPNDANAHFNLGVVLAATGNPDAAIQEFRETVRINPKHAKALNNLGFCLAGKGKPDEAVQEYREALRIERDFDEAHYNLGLALAIAGNTDAAIQEFRETIRVNPNHVNGHNNLGVALAAKGDQDAAIRQFREALRIEPDYAVARENLAKALNSKL